MPRRVTLPSVDDLFRLTEGATRPTTTPRLPRPAVHAVPDQPVAAEPELSPSPDAGSEARSDARSDASQDGGAASGRIRHDEKMTVYVTSNELLAIEHARLTLRSHHGLVVDRGRLVREAIALVLADLEQNGDGSALVRQLTAEG